MFDTRNPMKALRQRTQALRRPSTARPRTVREVCLGILGCLLVLGVPCLRAWAEAQRAQDYSVTIASPLTKADDTQSGSVVMTLDHDGPVTIHVSAASSGSEVLRSSTNDTLTTSYKLAGPSLSNPDAEWVPSATFILPATSYGVQSMGPSSEIIIRVRAQTAAGRANDTGKYEASLVLTASWL